MTSNEYLNASSIVRVMACKFSNLTNNCRMYNIDRPEKCVLRNMDNEGQHPVSYFVMTGMALILSKKVYVESTLDEIKNGDEILNF